MRLNHTTPNAFCDRNKRQKLIAKVDKYLDLKNIIRIFQIYEVTLSA